MGDVDHSPRHVRTAVIDPNRHGPPGRDIGHAQPCAEWQAPMSGGQFARIEFFAARGPRSLRVEAGNSLRGRLCLPSIFPRRERGMLFYGSDAPVRLE